MDAARPPPVSEPANKEFFLPIETGRMAFSAMLLSISRRPSVVNQRHFGTHPLTLRKALIRNSILPQWVGPTRR
jgi:hypothetical protein